MMKKIASIFLMVLTPFLGFSQGIDSTIIEEKMLLPDTADGEVYTIVEKMPDMPGGIQKYLGENVKFPPKAKSKGITGRVFVNFTVGKDGKIRDVKILRGVHDLLDAEALRVVMAMPDWIPGEQRGIKVPVSYNMAIGFKLEMNNSPKLANPELTNGNIEYRKGLDFIAKKRYSKAITMFKKSIEKNPKSIDSYYNRGLCYFKINLKDEACSDWRKAKELGDEEVGELLEKHCN